MKVLRSTEWEPMCWIESFPGLGPVYVFLNKRYGDVAAFKVAKYVDVPADDVFIYDAIKRIISLRCDENETKESSLPRYKVASK